MDRPSVEQLSAELERLMREQIESLRQTSLGIRPEELRRQKERLHRIREVSADYLEALKKSRGSSGAAT
jgi:signal transduction histidine kinase